MPHHQLLRLNCERINGSQLQVSAVEAAVEGHIRGDSAAARLLVALRSEAAAGAQSAVRRHTRADAV